MAKAGCIPPLNTTEIKNCQTDRTQIDLPLSLSNSPIVGFYSNRTPKSNERSHCCACCLFAVTIFESSVGHYKIVTQQSPDTLRELPFYQFGIDKALASGRRLYWPALQGAHVSHFGGIFVIKLATTYTTLNDDNPIIKIYKSTWSARRTEPPMRIYVRSHITVTLDQFRERSFINGHGWGGSDGGRRGGKKNPDLWALITARES